MKSCSFLLVDKEGIWCLSSTLGSGASEDGAGFSGRPVALGSCAIGMLCCVVGSGVEFSRDIALSCGIFLAVCKISASFKIAF